MPRTTSSFCSSDLIRLTPCGICAWKPAAMSGAVIMKMISSTSITSAIGVTLMSALTEPWLLVDMATAARHLGREVLREGRAAELVPHALDQIVDEFLARVRHLDGEEVDLRLEVVVQPHRRDGRHQAEGRRDQRLGDTGRHRRQTAGPAARRHAGERVDDTHRGAQQADE